MDGDSSLAQEEWLEVPDNGMDELSMSALTEQTSSSRSISSDDCDDVTARNILDAPLQTFASQCPVTSALQCPVTSALQHPVTSALAISRGVSRGLKRGIKCAIYVRRRMRTSKLRVPTFVTSACTRAAVGHVVSTLLAPAASVPWRIATAVADNQYVAVAACAATLLAAALVWWPRCFNPHTAGGRT